MRSIRTPAVAGLFYPKDPQELEQQISDLLANHPQTQTDTNIIVAPHAGYIYSGGVAARAYNAISHCRHKFKHVVILGPSHRVSFTGAAIPLSDHFFTPLGRVPISKSLIQKITDFPFVFDSEKVHLLEHSLEVQLPFLQCILEHFDCLPIAIAGLTPDEVKSIIQRLWSIEDTLIVVSSDLSHDHNYHEAQKIDVSTANQIQNLSCNLNGNQACGFCPLNGVLAFAKSHHLKVSKMDILNSGDTAGEKNRVVGYGAFAIH